MSTSSPSIGRQPNFDWQTLHHLNCEPPSALSEIENKCDAICDLERRKRELIDSETSVFAAIGISAVAAVGAQSLGANTLGLVCLGFAFAVSQASDEAFQNLKDEYSCARKSYRKDRKSLEEWSTKLKGKLEEGISTRNLSDKEIQAIEKAQTYIESLDKRLMTVFRSNFITKTS